MQPGRIWDTIARIKNGTRVNKISIQVLKSKVVLGILDVLKKEGYINSYESVPTDFFVTVYLKYDENKKSVINDIFAKSKPGLRQYISKQGVLSKRNYGITIVSTSKGIMSGSDANHKGIGGELLLEVF